MDFICDKLTILANCSFLQTRILDCLWFNAGTKMRAITNQSWRNFLIQILKYGRNKKHHIHLARRLYIIAQFLAQICVKHVLNFWLGLNICHKIHERSYQLFTICTYQVTTNNWSKWQQNNNQWNFHFLTLLKLNLK